MAIKPMIEYVKQFTEDQIEQKYKDYLTQVRPMTGVGVVQVLNKICSFIDKGRCYLEAGTHRGSTLLGAALDNPNIKFYGMDTFLGHNNPWEVAPFKDVEEGLQDAIKRLSCGNVDYFKTTYQDFFGYWMDENGGASPRTNINGEKVEVYFYDAAHEMEHQYQGVKSGLQVLSDEALILVDDSGWQNRGNVWGALNKLLKEDSRLSIVREINSIKPNHLEGMWNGIAVLEFRR